MIAPSQMQQANTPQSLAQAPIPQVDVDRKRTMREAWKAYRGLLPDPLKVAKDQPNDNIKSNRCAPIVDKGVSFLFGKVLKIEATDETTDDSDNTPVSLPPPPQPGMPPAPMKPKKPKKPKPSPIQDYLDGLWGDDDDRMTLLSKAATNGGVCGQTFVKLIPPVASTGMKFPRLVVLDPELIRIVTPPDDCDLIIAYIIEYPTGNDWQRRQIIARVDPDGLAEEIGESDLDDTWTITNYKRYQSGTWQQVGAPEEWSWPFAPIFTCQNMPNPNEAWGMPDLSPDIIAMNKSLNFVQSNTSRIIKYHGHPITWASGMQASALTISVDGVICLPSPDSKLEKLAAMEHFDGLMNFASTLRSDMDEQSRVPAVALGRLESLPKGNISGVALQLLFQPLIEKTLSKQRVYGRLVREICRAALVVAGLIETTDFEDYGINLHWPNLLPIDDLAAAQTAQLLSALGVSKDTLMSELGYNADDEAGKNAEEDAQTMLNYSRGVGLPPAPTNQPGQPPQTAPQAVGAH